MIDSSVITNKAKEGHTLETGAVESVATVASVASVSRSWRESDSGAGSWREEDSGVGFQRERERSWCEVLV